MVNLTLAVNKKNTRFTIKNRNKTALSISSNDSEKVVSKKVKKYTVTSIVDELLK